MPYDDRPRLAESVEGRPSATSSPRWRMSTTGTSDDNCESLPVLVRGTGSVEPRGMRLILSVSRTISNDGCGESQSEEVSF